MYLFLVGHKLACIQLSQDNMTYDVVCYCHEIMESCLSKLTNWRVVKPSALSNPNTVVCTLLNLCVVCKCMCVHRYFEVFKFIGLNEYANVFVNIIIIDQSRRDA